MKYKLTLYLEKFMKVGDEYKTVEVASKFEFEWETLVAFLGCIVDNSLTNKHRFEIEPIEVEA